MSRGRLPHPIRTRPLGALVFCQALVVGLLADPFPRRACAEDVEPTRIYADGYLAWIYKQPERDPAPIGVLRGGQSVRLRAEMDRPASQPIKGGCGRGWYAVEPFGYMCLDHTASLTPTRYFESMEKLLPQQGDFPYEYALSMGTPSYRRIPTPKEWERKERPFGQAKQRDLPPHWRGHEELATNPDIGSATPFSFLDDSGSVSRLPEPRLVRRDVPFGSMLALTHTFEAHGRKFGQSADGTIVGMDRMVAFRKSDFQGVALGPDRDDYALPLAWSKKKTRLYRVSSHCGKQPTNDTDRSPGRLATKATPVNDECLVPLDDFTPPRRPHRLSGRLMDVAGTQFVEVHPTGTWVPLDYVYLAEKESPPSSVDREHGQRWISFSISRGTLTAYEGEMPVFATLASPGIGGVPSASADALSTRTTPVGTFRINFKYRTDDMSPEQTEHRKFWIAEVPHTMYFAQPFAIHVAYWHESFGEPMSGGCINVSPKDGRRLFDFTAPHVPDGWYGAGASLELGLGTTIVVSR